MSLNNIYVRWFEPGDLLDGGAAAAAWDKVAFDRRNKTTRAGEAELALAGPPRSTAWRCGGRRSWRPASTLVHRAARRRARTGSSSICPALAPIA